MSDLADRLRAAKYDSLMTREMAFRLFDEAADALTTLQSNPSGEVGELIERLTWAHDRDALFREATTQLRAQAECIKELEAALFGAKGSQALSETLAESIEDAQAERIKELEAQQIPPELVERVNMSVIGPGVSQQQARSILFDLYEHIQGVGG